ncbi:MAG: hypothetical protein ABI895_04045 [Deltaproteobacteria bacterium]
MREGLMQHGRSVTLLGLIVSTLGTACAAGHVQAGPMLGYSPARGVTWGWEAGAGVLGAVRASTGGSYRVRYKAETAHAAPAPDVALKSPRARRAGAPVDYAPPNAVHYVALEPLGLSIGADSASTGRVGLMAGLWAGWMLDPNPEGAFGSLPGSRFLPEFDCPDYEPEPALLLSGALGLRYLGGEWEVYFTPKAVMFYCAEYAN